MNSSGSVGSSAIGFMPDPRRPIAGDQRVRWSFPALVELGAVLDATRPVAMAMERGDCHRDVEGVGDGRHG